VRRLWARWRTSKVPDNEETDEEEGVPAVEDDEAGE